VARSPVVFEEALPSAEFLFGGVMAPQRVLEGDLSGMDGHDDLGLPACIPMFCGSLFNFRIGRIAEKLPRPHRVSM
jgi:hypothetical protein